MNVRPERTFSTIDRYAAVVALLMAGPKTIAELHEALGMKHQRTSVDGVRQFVRELQSMGAVYVCEIRTPAIGGRVEVYALQPSIAYYTDAQPHRTVRKLGAPAQARAA